jgi:hypothetical protein
MDELRPLLAALRDRCRSRDSWSRRVRRRAQPWFPWVACFVGGLVSGLPYCPAPACAQAVQVDPNHPLYQPLQHAYQARKALETVRDYEAVFSKRELIGRQYAKATMRLKIREAPYSVYMLFDTPYKGREVLYVDGKNKGMILAHEEGFKKIAGTVSLAPDSDTAMEGNKYPITMIGLRNLVDRVIAQWEEESQFGEVDVVYRPNNTIGGTTECKVIESTHPRPRKQFKFHLTRLFIEKETGLPVRVEQYGFPKAEGQPPPLVEEYTYTQIQTNLGLTDRDFDHTNPNYAFPR